MPPDPAAPQPPLTLHWSGLTHRGRFRKNNEDSFLALGFNGHEVTYLGKIGQASLGPQDFVFAVSDGMGGAAAGEFASKITVEKITRLLPRSFRASAAGMAVDFADVLPELFAEIHKALMFLGASYEECAGMGATLSLTWFAPGWMYFGHIGDSRIYYLPRDGGITQVTHDHSHVGWLRRSGRINEREQRMHPAKNSLQQALGAGHQSVDPQIGAVGCEAGDRFLLCSDGLVDGLWDRQLEEMGRSLPIVDVARLMVDEAVSASGRDNTTALVVEVGR